MPKSEDPPRKTRRIGWPVRCLLLVVLMWPIYKWIMRVSPANMTAIAAELRQRKLPAGYHQDVPLTGGDKFKAVNGSVDLMIHPDGKMAFLLKTSEGWRHDFTGLLYLDSGYPYPSERLLPNGPDFASDLFEPGRDDFFVSEKLSDNVFKVHFDLN